MWALFRNTEQTHFTSPPFMFCLWCLVVTASVLGTLGTHTTSTDAGNLVPNASLLFAAPPSATLALYKICWSSSGCAYMVAAFDATIHEDIDIIFIFIGGGNPNYVQDSRLYVTWCISCNEEKF